MASETTDAWNPQQYLRHAGPRTRPFRDLLARIPELPVARPRIADLGCGAGGPTALLADRWPDAIITGYDSSPAMLAEAAVHAGPLRDGGELTFRQADIAAWQPDEPLDLIVTNAALQWVPGGTARFPDWIAALRPGGVFAFQVPGNHDSPAHRALRDQCTTGRWASQLAGVLRDPAPVLSPAEYVTELTAAGCAPDVWETTYLHILAGDDPVLGWMEGTGLRPVLTALRDDPAATRDFLAEYRDRLRAAYPPEPYGTVLPFRRIFAVARKPGGGPDASDGPTGAPWAGIAEFDHVQLSAPPGSEPELRAFYTGVLGMTELIKPPALAARGGCWFRAGHCELHLSIDPEHRPAARAHPGIRVARLQEFAAGLERAGHEPEWDDLLPGYRRCYLRDPFGNRLEFLEPLAAGG